MVDFSDEEIQAFSSCMKVLKVQKKETFLFKGENCNWVAFINQGIIRAYYVADDQEKTADFLFQGNWISDYVSFLTHTPCKFNAEALEECELLLLYKEDMQRLYKSSQNAERFGRLIAENLFIHLNKRIYSFLTQTPEERYTNLLKRRPNVVQRIPQHYIASYLGVRPESLSRIRKKMVNQKNQVKS